MVFCSFRRSDKTNGVWRCLECGLPQSSSFVIQHLWHTFLSPSRLPLGPSVMLCATLFPYAQTLVWCSQVSRNHCGSCQPKSFQFISSCRVLEGLGLADWCRLEGGGVREYNQRFMGRSTSEALRVLTGHCWKAGGHVRRSGVERLGLCNNHLVYSHIQKKAFIVWTTQGIP